MEGVIENLKLGAIEGSAALIVILALALCAVAILLVLVITVIKAIKERKDALEDAQEDEFFAQYGVSGEEMRLNRQLSEMRNKVSSKKSVKKALLDEKHMIIVHDRVEVPVEVIVEKERIVEVEVPAPEPEVKEEPVIEVSPEEPAPVEEPKPIVVPVEDAPKPRQEVEAKPEVVPVEVAEEQQPAATPTPKAPSSAKLVPKKKPDDWSKYTGEYEGVYYDPEDACYYEGKPSPALAKKLKAKQAELEEEARRNKKEVIVKKVLPPFVALKTPKNPRKKPAKVSGFDESVIYGKYVIEHAVKEDGSTEYFYTLYDPTNKTLYESNNYSELEYCKTAISRFQSHVLIGEFNINVEDTKFFFELRRKSYVHKGTLQPTFEEANSLIARVKSYAQTDIIREQ